MKMKSLLLAPLSLVLAASAWAQPALDRARMQRDLDIMEMVLERLLSENSAPMMRLGGRAARGVYLPEFGVLFQLPPAWYGYSYCQIHAGDEEDAAVQEGMPPARAYGRRLPSGRAAEIFDEELFDFFSRYADAIGQLRPEDRIAVYRSAGPEVAIFFSFPGMENGRIASAHRETLAWVKKSDLDALQSGRIGTADLKQRMSLTQAQRDLAGIRLGQEEIDMLAGMLETELDLPRGTAEGIDIENYGAVLFTRADFNAAFPRRMWNWGMAPPASNIPAGQGSNVSTPKTIEDYLRATERANRQRAQNWQAEYEQFKEKLLSAVAEGGQRLGYLRAQDRVVVVADLPNAPEKQPHQFVCAVKKQHLEEYQDRKISQEQLRKAMTLYEQ